MHKDFESPLTTGRALSGSNACVVTNAGAARGGAGYVCWSAAQGPAAEGTGGQPAQPAGLLCKVNPGGNGGRSSSKGLPWAAGCRPPAKSRASAAERQLRPPLPSLLPVDEHVVEGDWGLTRGMHPATLWSSPGFAFADMQCQLECAAQPLIAGLKHVRPAHLQDVDFVDLCSLNHLAAQRQTCGQLALMPAAACGLKYSARHHANGIDAGSGLRAARFYNLHQCTGPCGNGCHSPCTQPPPPLPACPAHSRGPQHFRVGGQLLVERLALLRRQLL